VVRALIDRFGENAAWAEERLKNQAGAIDGAIATRPGMDAYQTVLAVIDELGNQAVLAVIHELGNQNLKR
jgi:hypothetical protein